MSHLGWTTWRPIRCSPLPSNKVGSYRSSMRSDIDAKVIAGVSDQPAAHTPHCIQTNPYTRTRTRGTNHEPRRGPVLNDCISDASGHRCLCVDVFFFLPPRRRLIFGICSTYYRDLRKPIVIYMSFTKNTLK